MNDTPWATIAAKKKIKELETDISLLAGWILQKSPPSKIKEIAEKHASFEKSKS